MPPDLEDDGFIDVSIMMHCVVYMLVRKGTVVYVGQSKVPLQRLATHWRAKKGNPRKVGFTQKIPVGFAFDAVWVQGCMLNELNGIEAAMIRKYQPKYNQKLMPIKPPVALEMLLDLMPSMALIVELPQPRQTAPWRRL